MSAASQRTQSHRRVAEVLRDAGALAIPRTLDAWTCAGLIADMRKSPAVVTQPITLADLYWLQEEIDAERSNVRTAAA